MAEKFGLRGLRITAMIGFMIGYLWWRGCDGVICVILYIFAATTLLLAIIIVWTAKEALDKFAKDHHSGTWLVLDSHGIGGEAGDRSFKMTWSQFRRVVERNQLWLLETVNGGLDGFAHNRLYARGLACDARQHPPTCAKAEISKV